ncbi:MAG: cation diffusion facilitator family transporter [Paludibacter sp.]|nr:cation diffusion facilitator family transporter [Paludibacter sp.]
MNRVKEARKVTWIGFAVNMVLTIFKIIAGIVGKSTAMIADGIHSLSDFVTDVLVILFIGISDKDKDDDHRYGHGKFETFATLLISLALILVGIGIFWSGLSKIIQVFQGEVLEQPTYLALVAALVSIVSKESLFWYTKFVGDKINSNAVIANAWHHRSDALSSIGTALGISGAIFLGESWRILDPIAGVIVSIFILKVAFELGMPSVHELLERSLPKETEKSIIETIESHPDVIFQHNLKTRKIGNIFAIDVHIKLDKDISFVKSHDVATEIEVS